MTKKAVNIADVPDNDGETPRQKNRKKVHNIPVGSFVESKETGFRLYVAKHERDCDETPLYYLSTNPDSGKNLESFKRKMWQYREEGVETEFELAKAAMNMVKGSLDGGYPEEDLRVISEPENK